MWTKYFPLKFYTHGENEMFCKICLLIRSQEHGVNTLSEISALDESQILSDQIGHKVVLLSL